MDIKIYPDYDLLEKGRYDVHLQTFIRKQGPDGIWYLIPIREWFSYGKKIGPKARKEGLVHMLKTFHQTCYRTIYLYDVNVPKYLLGDDTHGRVLRAIKDENQQPEGERLRDNYIQF